MIESDPNCADSRRTNESTRVQENATVLFTCGVNYSGSWTSVMKWQQTGNEVIHTDHFLNNSTNPNKSVTYSLTVVTTKAVNGNRFSCTTYFTSANPDIMPQTHQSYTHKWTSVPILLKDGHTDSKIIYSLVTGDNDKVIAAFWYISNNVR